MLPARQVPEKAGGEGGGELAAQATSTGMSPSMCWSPLSGAFTLSPENQPRTVCCAVNPPPIPELPPLVVVAFGRAPAPSSDERVAAGVRAVRARPVGMYAIPASYRVSHVGRSALPEPLKACEGLTLARLVRVVVAGGSRPATATESVTKVPSARRAGKSLTGVVLSGSSRTSMPSMPRPASPRTGAGSARGQPSRGRRERRLRRAGTACRWPPSVLPARGGR